MMMGSMNPVNPMNPMPMMMPMNPTMMPTARGGRNLPPKGFAFGSKPPV